MTARQGEGTEPVSYAGVASYEWIVKATPF
jgi:hypothetical protein